MTIYNSDRVFVEPSDQEKSAHLDSEFLQANTKNCGSKAKSILKIIRSYKAWNVDP